MRPISLDDLKPGDVLLYRGKGFFSWAIRVKTWSDVSHTETYLGRGRSAASRDGLGVNNYPFRWTGLRYVYRPNVPFNIRKGIEWNNGATGQKYDWLGLLVFYLAAKQGHLDKMFCSEHTHRMARAMGYKPFGDFDCDYTSPGMFKASPCYDLIWSADATH